MNARTLFSVPDMTIDKLLPEVDDLLLAHMIDHGRLPTVQVHGQVHKVALGDGQVDLEII